MSSAVHQLQLDQEVTTFSLSLAKNLLSRAGISLPTITRLPSSPEEVLSPIYANNSNATSPYTWKLRLSNDRPSYMSVHEFENYGSPTVKAFSSPRQSSESPALSRGESQNYEKEESPIKVFGHNNTYEAYGNTISCFTDNFEPDESEIMPSVALIARQEFSHRLHKEGSLQKKATNIFVGWQKRYFEVKPFKISYAKSQEMLKANQGIRSINLLVHRCEIMEIKENAFSIKVEGIQKKIKLKADSLREAIEWVDFLKEMFAYAMKHGYKDDKYIQQEKKKLYKADNITEEDFLKEAGTGDLLLFKDNPNQVKKQRRLSKAFAQISMVVRVYNDLYIYDDLHEKKNGARLKSWKDFKDIRGHSNTDIIVYRRLHIEDQATRELVQGRLYKFLMSHNETKYDPSLDKTVEELVLPESPKGLKIKSMVVSSASTIPPISPKKEYSQISPLGTPELEVDKRIENMSSANLVALAYKYVGLLDAHMPVADYLPVSFSKKIHLLKKAYLSGEYELILLN